MPLLKNVKMKILIFMNHSLVHQIIRHKDYFKVKVNNHTIICKDVIHATRYPFIKKGLYFLKMFQSLESIV